MTFTEIMEYLMKNGGNVNAANPDGQTVLMFAAGKKNPFILRLLKYKVSPYASS